MEANDLKPPPFRIVTFRDGQEIIAEDIETEVAARVRFASAIDLCKSCGDEHTHHVELRSGGETIEAWPSRQS